MNLCHAWGPKQATIRLKINKLKPYTKAKNQKIMFLLCRITDPLTRNVNKLATPPCTQTWKSTHLIHLLSFCQKLG